MKVYLGVEEGKWLIAVLCLECDGLAGMCLLYDRGFESDCLEICVLALPFAGQSTAYEAAAQKRLRGYHVHRNTKGNLRLNL
jgi:hypothetical protein